MKRLLLTVTLVVCSCNTAPAPAAPVPPAPPPHAELPPAALMEDVSSAIHRSTAVRWTTVASIFGEGTQSCIDGRATGPVLGTPGGDAGEILVGLAALERASGERVDLTALDGVLDAYFESFGRLYMHTDEHALGRLASALRADARVRAKIPEDREALRRLILDPPADLREPILDLMTQPEHVGCGHLRLALTESDRYRVRPELVRAVLAATLRLAWRHPGALEYAVLEGEHKEEGIIEVELGHPVHAHSRVPLIAPHDRGHEFFVHHGDVTAFIRHESGWFFLEHATRLLPAPPLERRYLETLDSLAARQASETIKALARGLPVVHVRADGSDLTVAGAH